MALISIHENARVRSIELCGPSLLLDTLWWDWSQIFSYMIFQFYFVHKKITVFFVARVPVIHWQTCWGQMELRLKETLCQCKSNHLWPLIIEVLLNTVYKSCYFSGKFVLPSNIVFTSQGSGGFTISHFKWYWEMKTTQLASTFTHGPHRLWKCLICYFQIQLYHLWYELRYENYHWICIVMYSSWSSLC